MARKRKKADEGHENSERWLLTYSDMITLLMAFFIMMYSMSVLNLTKFQQVAIAIRSGFGGVVKGGGEHLMDNPAGRKTIKVENGSFDSDSMQETLGKLNDFVIGKGMQKEVQVSDEPRGIVITLAAEGLLFQRGSAELTDKAAPVLDKVVDVLKATPKKKIMVEGHTCNMPINSPIFPSNWELSSARASCVVRFFQSRNINGSYLAAVGYGSTRPRVKNDTEEHRAMNRRVDIIILRGSLEVERGLSNLQNTPNSKSQQHLKPNLHNVIDMGPAEGSDN